MNFDGLIPVIQCRHIDETLAFYQQAFRYIVINRTDTEAGLQWAHLKSDNTFLMLQKTASTEQNQFISGNILLYYYTSDIAAQHQFMTAKGFSVGEIENTTYDIKQFYVTDPEGNTLAVGQQKNK